MRLVAAAWFYAFTFLALACLGAVTALNFAFLGSAWVLSHLGKLLSEMAHLPGHRPRREAVRKHRGF